MGKKKTEAQGTIQTGLRQILFNYLKDSLRIELDCCKNWGHYENDDVTVTMKLYLKNPETGSDELVSQDSATA